jgi:2-methylcitrate dehydratase PrpD
MAQPKGVTATLADFALAPATFDAETQAAGLRSFVNIVGCTIGGARHPASDLAFEVASEFAGAPVATVIGRGKLVDALSAAYLNSLAASAHAFDDTHLSTVLHPAAPVSAALLAVVDRQAAAGGPAISGQMFLEAFTLGIEIQCRLGVALLLPPAEGQVGWYASGIAGGISAAAASARLLGLSAEQTRWAIGIAGNQASGFRQTHGSMCTSFVPGHAARCGLQSAVLAARGFTGSDAALEGANGYFDVFAHQANPAAAIAGLGQTWHVLDNAFKPYPCGIVIHPVLDACLALTRDRVFDAGGVKAVRARVNPLCLTLCDRPSPANNQWAQVSVQHWIAAALARGKAGLPEGADECVNDAGIAALRAKVEAVGDPSVDRDGGVVEIELSSGEILTETIAHCRGSRDRPLSNNELSEKFLGQAVPELGDDKAQGLLEMCWAVADAPDMAAVLVRTIPD